MNFLANTWVLWLILCALLMGGMVFHRQNRKTVGSLYTSAEDFSIRTILFGMRKGEGDIFLGYLLAIVFFSMTLAGLVRWFQTLMM